MSSEIDFQAIKRAIRIEAVIPKLDLQKVTRNGEQYRCPCPQCQRGGDRAIVITPSKAAYYCFHAKRGGDCIALVAHVRGTGQVEAARWLMEQFPQGREALPQRGAQAPQSGNTSTRKRRKATNKPPESKGRAQLIQTQQEQPDNVVELRPQPKRRKPVAKPEEEYSLMDWIDEIT